MGLGLPERRRAEGIRIMGKRVGPRRFDCGVGERVLITTDRGIPHACARDVSEQAAGRDHLGGRGTAKRKPLLRARGEAREEITSMRREDGRETAPPCRG